VEFIEHIENNLIKLDDKTKNSIRKEIIPMLNNIKYSSINSIDLLIKQGLKVICC